MISLYFILLAFCHPSILALVWPDDCYIIKGEIFIPYAEIIEPFTVWYETKKNRSRSDFYDSVQIYQFKKTPFNPYGIGQKVVPFTTDEFLNQKHCFQIDGTEIAPIDIEGVFPDFSNFEIGGTKVVNGENCTIYTYFTNYGGKKGAYYFYRNIKTGLPVRLELFGYNIVSQSHYDHYVLNFNHYSSYQYLSDDIFTLPKSLECTGFPGPGKGEQWHVINPLYEFKHNVDSYIDNAFEKFKSKHNKKYKDNIEHSLRKHTFHQNLRFIENKNRQGLGYKLSVNHLADLTDDEMKVMRGKLKSQGYNGGLPFNNSQFINFKIPSEWNWRLRGAVTQVKDQAICGSCWSFGTTGCVEGAYFLKYNDLVRLSQQELIDCSWGEGNNACDGGEDFRAYQWIMKHGLAQEKDYGNYKGQDFFCFKDTVKPTAFMKGYVNITSGDADALKFSMVNFGPISVAIDASHKSLSFYSHGVYYEPKCGNKLNDLDHAVLAVGYGTLDGEPYWLIKNSWSTYWGNDGYVLMSQRDNNCGVTTSATYVIIE